MTEYEKKFAQKKYADLSLRGDLPIEYRKLVVTLNIKGGKHRKGGGTMESLALNGLTITWLNGGVTHMDGGAMFGVVPKPLWGKKNIRSMRTIKLSFGRIRC